MNADSVSLSLFTSSAILFLSLAARSQRMAKERSTVPKNEGSSHQSCCPNGSASFLPEDPSYIPRGKIISYDKFGNCTLKAYCVGHGQKALIFVHDVFGLNSGLNKLICDKLASMLLDYVIIAPDFFIHGNILGEDPVIERGIWILPKLLWTIFTGSIFSFFKKYSWDNAVGSIFDKVTYHLLANGVESFAIIGFCYGTYVGFRACGSACHRDMIFANISVHPSVDGVAYMTSEKEDDIVGAVFCPQMVAATLEDSASWKPNGKIQAALSKETFGSQCEFYLINEHHGFCTRGDTRLECTRVAIEECLDKTVQFLRKTEK